MSVSTASITTDCTCFKQGEDGEYLEDANGNNVPADYCDGDCWEYQLEDINSLIEVWLDIIGETFDTKVKITCNSQRWTRTSFKAIVHASQILEALAVNGDFRLKFRLSDHLEATRYSHDEPTGTAPFVIEVASEEDLADLEY